MNQSKRSTLQAVGASGILAALTSIGMLKPGIAYATPIQDAFKAKGAVAGLKALGAEDATMSDKVSLNAPDIAENGAVVPVAVTSSLDNVEMIAVIVDKNPNALAGAFEFMGNTPPDVTLRVKMGQSSDIIALVKADGKFYMARKEVKVTLGGCGG